jgi:hypothetical protein
LLLGQERIPGRKDYFIDEKGQFVTEKSLFLGPEGKVDRKGYFMDGDGTE